jgi:hypothetical protein
MSVHAYGYDITGRIVEVQTLKPIAGANIHLFTPDSTRVNNVVSTANGRFVIKKALPGNYSLTITYMGMEPKTIQIANLTDDIDIGVIEMNEQTVAVGEVVVQADQITRIDRQILFPTTTQISTSATGLDVLSKLMLPGIMVNTVTDAVSSVNPRGVQIRINDVKSTVRDLLAIHPKNIVRIEHIDLPGARYGDVGEVINVITRQYQRGGVAGTSMRHALSTVYGIDNIYARTNYKESEIGVTYYTNYRNYSEYSTTNQTFLLKDETELHVDKNGETKTPYLNMPHYVTLSYNWNHENNTILNAQWYNTYSKYGRTYLQDILENGKQMNQSTTETKDQSYTPSLDLYFFHQLSEKQSIIVNTVGTLIHTDYNMGYTEYIFPGETLDAHYAYSADGKKYSFIGEAVYEYNIRNYLAFSSGLTYSQAFTKNLYNNQDEKETVNSMRSSEQYAFVQLRGKIKKLTYQTGLGVKRQYFNEYVGKYDKMTFRPSITLSYPLADQMSLRYNFYILSFLPTLSALSNFEQQMNKYEVTAGNPQLKPGKSYANILTYDLHFNRINIQCAGYYQINKDPTATSVRRIDNGDSFYFLYNSELMKSFQHLQFMLFVNAELIKDRLFLSARGGINRFINIGYKYAHYYNDYFGGIQLDGNYKNWILSASLTSDMSRLTGETIFYTSKNAYLDLKYRHKNIHIGIGVLNPLLPDGAPSGTRQIYPIAQSESWNYTRDTGNMVYLSLNYSLSFGHKYNSGQKKLYNSDTESGVMK